jgi:hypothetical protein
VTRNVTLSLDVEAVELLERLKQSVRKLGVNEAEQSS